MIRRPRTRRVVLLAATLTIIALSAAVALWYQQHRAGSSTRATRISLSPGRDAGPLSTFHIPQGASAQLPATWPHLPPQGGDIAVVAYAPATSPDAGTTVTIRAGRASALPFSQSLTIFQALQASLHRGWKLVRSSALHLPGIAKAHIVIAQYDSSGTGQQARIISEDLIARDTAGNAWHITALGPATSVGSRFLQEVTLSLRRTT